jgi:hypothetical protein
METADPQAGTPGDGGDLGDDVRPGDDPAGGVRAEVVKPLPPLTCDVCEKNEALGVASLPGIPMSVATCRDCLRAGAIPLWAAVANTVCIGGMNESAPWWTEVVDATLTHLGVSREDFDAMVAEDLAHEAEDLERTLAESGPCEFPPPEPFRVGEVE